MNKVYISKTFDSHPDDFTQVQHDLNKMGIEIIRFEGGKYSPSIIDPADIIISIAPREKIIQENDGDNYIVKASKGIYSESLHGSSQNIDSYLYNPIDKTYHKIIKREIVDSTSWKGHFGNIIASSRANTIEALDHIITHGETEETDEDSAYRKPTKDEIDELDKGSMA